MPEVKATEGDAPEQVNVGETPSTPAGEALPEKYRGKTIADVVRMHQELERTLGSRQPQPNGNAPESAPGRIPEPQADFAARMEPFAREFFENGGLSAASYQKLEQQGKSKAEVDTVLNGLKAQGELVEIRARQAVGGDDEWAGMMNWASANMSAAERQQFNSCKDPALFQTLVSGLHARYRGAVGGDPSLQVVGSSAGTGGTVGYASQDEMLNAMRVKDDSGRTRYEKDPAYRAEVQRKVAASSWARETQGVPGWDRSLAAR